MTNAFVQKAFSSPGGTPASVTATFGAGVGSGNLVVGTVTYGSTTAIVAANIADNHSVNPVIIDFVADGGGPVGTATFYFKNVTNGMTSVTFTAAGSPGVTGIEIQEISGADTVAPLDVHNMASTAGGGTSISTPSVTTNANGEYIYCSMFGPSTGFTTVSGAGGTGAPSFTLENNDLGGQPLGADSFAIQTTAGAVQGTFTIAAAQTYITAIATFKAAAGGGDTLGGAMQMMMM